MFIRYECTFNAPGSALIPAGGSCFTVEVQIRHHWYGNENELHDFSLTVKAATLIFISGSGSAISSAKEGKSGFIYNLVKR